MFELQKLLKETPEMLEYLRLIKDGENNILPLKIFLYKNCVIINKNSESGAKFLEKKNIMLLFLSDVKTSGRSISVANYKDIGETKTTNESAVRYLATVKKIPPDKIFCFVSNKVKQTITTEVDKVVEDYQEDGKTFTHIEYFKKRISEAKAVVGDIDKVIDPCEFDENANIEQTMKTVIEMASKIQDYISKLKEDTEVTLHVDMTGGMRHASLMMLVITRLIQYSGVKIGNILYSNFDRDRPKRGELQFVEESNEIYKLFDVISGAYEFVSFGSVEAIQDYFEEKNPQGELKNLLDAMKRFSNAIKICQTSIIEGELKNLNTHIETFKNAGNKNLHENLFANLIDTIKKEYGILLSNEVSRIDIIRWCMNKGLWQQVLTLCTEWLPEIIVEYDIYYTNDDKIKADSKSRGASNFRSWKQNFIISYQNSEEDKIRKSIVKGFFDLVESLNNQLLNKEKPEITFDYVIKDLEKFEKLSNFFKEYQDFSKRYPKCATISQLNKKWGLSSQKLSVQYPTIGSVLENIKRLNIERPSLNNLPFEVFKKLNSNQLQRIFDVDFYDMVDYVNTHDFTENKDWEKRKEQYITLLQERKATSDFDENETFEMLKGYYDIRVKRNQINHANGKASNEISKLKEMVRPYLTELERYKK